MNFRLFTRGADHQGNVANFVESEQIIEYGLNKSSFVQVSKLFGLIEKILKSYLAIN